MNNEVMDFIGIFKDKIIEKCKNIIGIYLFGSLAYGGFEEKSSDIDLVVITKTLLDKNDLENIKNIHKKIIEINNIWGNRLEVSYTPINMFNEKSIPNIPRPYYNGTFYEKAGYGNEWLINNYLLLNYGKRIYGPEINTIINYEISIDEIKKSCVNDFYKEWFVKINNYEWLNKSENQAYIVLNICRIIYTIKESKIGNKKESAKWVKEKYVKWKKLIEEAEEWEFNKIMNKENEINEYVKYMEIEIKNENKSNCA